MKRSPLAPVSSKRLASFEAAGIFPQSTFGRSAPIQRSREPKPRRVRETGFSKATFALIWARDLGCCVRCGIALRGERGFDFSVQHRRARQSGGCRRPDTNEAQNGILLCGSAGGCNGHVESERTEARDHGWAIRKSADPLVVPVLHAAFGWVQLTVDGGFVPSEPIEAAA